MNDSGTFERPPLLEERFPLRPVYLLVDESGSMYDVAHALDAALRSLLTLLQHEPLAAEGVRLSVIGFSDEARCYLPLSDVREVDRLPSLRPSGSTRYSAAFELAADRMEADLGGLQRSIYRPLVIFITDGLPNDGDLWRAAHEELLRRWRPLIVAYGFGDADRSVLSRIASPTGTVFTTSEGKVALPDLLQSLTASVARTIIGSSATASFGSDLVIEAPEGFQWSHDDDGEQT